jgi:hypothetical protein
MMAKLMNMFRRPRPENPVPFDVDPALLTPDREKQRMEERREALQAQLRLLQREVELLPRRQKGDSLPDD